MSGCVFLFSPFKVINANYLINGAIYQKHFCVKKGANSSFVPKAIPIGFEMTEKNVNKQTNGQTNIFVLMYVEI